MNHLCLQKVYYSVPLKKLTKFSFWEILKNVSAGFAWKNFFTKQQLQKDRPQVSLYVRQIRLLPTFPAESHSKCTWTLPEGRNQTLDLYIDCFRNKAQKELQKLSKKKSTINLSDNEKLTIKTLRCNKTIVIKPADKGGAIVVMNEEDYIKEAERQLHDEQHYAKLTQDPANAFKRDLKMLVQSFIEVDQDQILK